MTSKTADEPLQITAGTKISTEGLLSYGAVVFAESTTTLLEPLDFLATSSMARPAAS